MTKRIVFGVCGMSILSAGFVGFPVFANDVADISIVEMVDDGGTLKPWEDIVGAMPGEAYSAIPRAKNDGTIPVLVRMCLSGSATNESGDSVVLPANSFGISIGSGWTIDNGELGNPEDPASGNCYKYNSEVAVGDVTEPLFTEIVLNNSLGNEYKNNTFSLHLDAFASSTNPDEPVDPVDPGGGAGSGSGSSTDTEGGIHNPDTGTNTASYLEIVSPVLISAGAITLFAVGAYMIRLCIKHRLSR